MRDAVERRRADRLSDPRRFDDEHPLLTLLWNTLEWLLADSMFIFGYLDAISHGQGVSHVQCLEISATQSNHVSHAERMLELYHALTCADPALIPDTTLRRVVSIARLQRAAPLTRTASSNPTAGGDPT
jgi:hypothetical protein